MGAFRSDAVLFKITVDDVKHEAICAGREITNEQIEILMEDIFTQINKSQAITSCFERLDMWQQSVIGKSLTNKENNRA